MPERESEMFDNEPERAGIPGLTESGFVERVRPGQFVKALGENGLRVMVEKFDWNSSFSPVIEQLRRTKEEELTKQKQAEAAANGEDLSDVMTRAEIARQVNEEIADMFDNVNALYNTINKYRDRLLVVTSDIPAELKNITGIQGDGNCFLVQGGTREENEDQIFKNFESLNNAGGNTKLDRIFSHRGGLTEGHGDKDFFGWKLIVDGHEFVFIWNSPEESASATTETEGAEEVVAANDTTDEGVINLDSYRQSKNVGKDVESGQGDNFKKAA